MMLPRLAQGQTAPTEQLGRKRSDGSEGEVEVCGTPVCSLRSALYWMDVTSIPMQGMHGSKRAVTVIV